MYLSSDIGPSDPTESYKDALLLHFDFDIVMLNRALMSRSEVKLRQEICSFAVRGR